MPRQKASYPQPSQGLRRMKNHTCFQMSVRPESVMSRPIHVSRVRKYRKTARAAAGNSVNAARDAAMGRLRLSSLFIKMREDQRNNSRHSTSHAERDPLISMTYRKRTALAMRCHEVFQSAINTAVASTMIRPQAFFCVNTPCQLAWCPAEASSPSLGN